MSKALLYEESWGRSTSTSSNSTRYDVSGDFEEGNFRFRPLGLSGSNEFTLTPEAMQDTYDLHKAELIASLTETIPWADIPDGTIFMNDESRIARKVEEGNPIPLFDYPLPTIDTVNGTFKIAPLPEEETTA